MHKTKVVPTTTTALPATTVTIPVRFNTVKWPEIVESTAKGTWTAHDCERCIECTISLRRDADDRTLVSYQSLENGTNLSSLAVMVPLENTTDAINEVCTHLLASTFGFWSPLVASFWEKCTAIPTMKVTTNFLNGLSVTINPDQWQVMVEASQEVEKASSNMDFGTVTLRLHRHADGRMLSRLTFTSYSGESDYGFFFKADAKGCSQEALDVAASSMEGCLLFFNDEEEWTDLMREFRSKMNVALAPTPAKKAKKTKLGKLNTDPLPTPIDVLPPEPRAIAFTSEGGNKTPTLIQ